MKVPMVKVTKEEKSPNKFSTTTFKGRLLPLIANEELRAVLNTEGAAKKVFTQASENISTFTLSIAPGKRFVIATTDKSANNKRQVFISPVIVYGCRKGIDIIFTCKNESPLGTTSYTLSPVWSK